jgi:hypothetical protein
MIRLWEYVTQKKTEGKTLNVFDIDETLYNTFATVRVVKDGKVVRSLDNQQYNTYKLKPGEAYDYGEFRDAEHFRATSKPIENMFAKAKAIIGNQKSGSKTILLTARADFDDKEKFLQTFRDHGFPIDDVHVERAGNLAKLKHDVKPAISKLVILRKYINKEGFSKIRVYDDSRTNLAAILTLSKLYPNVEFETWLVNHNGRVTRYT